MTTIFSQVSENYVCLLKRISSSQDVRETAEKEEEKKEKEEEKKREEKEKTNGKSTQRDYLVKRTYFGLRSTPTLSRPMPDVQGSLPMATRI